MIPIVTPEEMAAIDAAAPEPVEVLIERAGSAVARMARQMLGGTYGRRVNVIAGKGNNGNDGRAAARILDAAGVRVRTFDAANCPPSLPDADLVIDAAYGTGFRGEWRAPRVGSAPVLAVDIPSGVNGLTGEASRGALPADRTVTFAALKPGLLLAAGRNLAGDVEVVDIGLDTARARAHLVEAEDVGGVVATAATDRPQVVAGRAHRRRQPGHDGCRPTSPPAPPSVPGAGWCTLSSPGVEADAPPEVVRRRLPAFDWSATVLEDLHRFHAVVIGPGLGREEYTVTAVRATVRQASIPLVVDGDGLFALAWDPDGAGPLIRRREAPTVLTPHDGEYGLLVGRRPDADRIDAVRRLAADLRAVVLLKGPVTIVGDPGGDVLVVAAGDARLATAGTGDVLSGVIGALLATGMDPFRAAASGAWIHAEAARRGPPVGLVAGDLVDVLPDVLADLG